MKTKARELLKQDQKTKALKLLRRKKAIEKRYAQIDVNLDNIQGMIDQIQITKETHQVVAALDKGNSALKELHKIMDPDTVQRLVILILALFQRKVLLVEHVPVIYKVLPHKKYLEYHKNVTYL